MPSPILDVCIPAYAPSPKLEAAIASILKNTTVPFNLLVSVKKQSVSFNRNDLFLMSHAPYISFLDDDVEMPEGWAEKLIETYEHAQFEGPMTVHGVTVNKPRIGMVGPRIVSADGSPQNASSHVPEGEQKVEYVCGAVMLWRREDWPWLFADPMYEASQFEDSDLTMQMLAMGGVSVVDGRVTVKHHNEMKANTSTTWKQNQLYFNSKFSALFAAREQAKEPPTTPPGVTQEPSATTGEG